MKVNEYKKERKWIWGIIAFLILLFFLEDYARISVQDIIRKEIKAQQEYTDYQINKIMPSVFKGVLRRQLKRNPYP